MLKSTTLIKWNNGIPQKEGRYLVRIYSGAIDIDIYSKKNVFYNFENIDVSYSENKFMWYKYNDKEIIEWCNLNDLENEF